MGITDRLKQQFSGKNVLVVGLGLQGGGVAVCRFFAELGAKVTATDLKSEEQLASSIEKLKPYDITYVLGKHHEEDFLSADVIFKGPSVPWTMPALAKAIEKGIPVEMETSFFAAHTESKVIGVTGTRGKSTTTNMIYELLKKKFNVRLAGNVPEAPAITLLLEKDPYDFTLLELSSWQLSGFHRRKISPAIAVFTNLYPDHLNYYGSMENYLADKKAIYLYQKEGDTLIVNTKLAQEYLLDRQQETKATIIEYSSADFKGQLQLKGEHNRENAAAASHVGKVVGLTDEVISQALAEFRGLPYRQQKIGEKNGIDFINDTTSTTPIALIKALEVYNDAPVVLLMGGFSKGLPIDEMMKKLESVYKIILLKGTFTEEIKPLLKSQYADKLAGEFSTMTEAVEAAYKLLQTEEKGYVLLSPAAASFGLFRNEFHRGDEFDKAVLKIISKKEGAEEA